MLNSDDVIFFFIYGLFATLLMTLVMAVGMGTGIAPMPEPIPLAIARLLLDSSSLPLLIAVGMGAHFLYGGVCAVIYGGLFEEYRNVVTGLIWGVVLWLIMHVLVLPVLGWGLFATAVNPAIAVATLVLHLIYGGFLGFALRTG